MGRSRLDWFYYAAPLRFSRPAALYSCLHIVARLKAQLAGTRISA